jgi:hypothetical protein
MARARSWQLTGTKSSAAVRCLVAILASCLPCGAESGQPILSVCEALQGLSQYAGKVVIVIGRLDFTPRGSWLDLDCPKQLTIGSYVWNDSVAISNLDLIGGLPPAKPAHFSWPKYLLNLKWNQLLAASQARAGGDHWVAIYGRLEAHVPLRTVPGSDGKPRGDGYGYAHSDPAQLIAGVGSVIDLPAR